MSNLRFFSDEALSLGATVHLSENASTHATRVLRLEVGDTIMLFDGSGFDYTCELISIKKNAVQAIVKFSQKITTESPLPITLLQGISSGDRMDYTIQKAVELGVTHIQPLHTERSVVKLSAERAQKRLEHWQGIVYAACEQSGRAVAPKIELPIPLNTWLSKHPQANASRIFLNPIGAKRLADLPKPTGEIQLLIGAEGGLSPQEISIASTNGFLSIMLGPRILRTETAALTAIAAMQTLWGDF